MSLVVAVRDKKRIVFGSDTQSSTGGNKAHDTTKIWEVPELPGAIMGSVGSMRASQIIQYNKVIDLNDVINHGEIDTAFIINSLVPIIVGLLQANGICCEIPEEGKESVSTMIPNTFLFAIEDKAWLIWHDLSVSELGNYLAIGSGSDVANGALFATPDKNPFERIVTCIDAAADSTLYVDTGVDLLATDYYEEDEELIAKALNLTMDIEFTPDEKIEKAIREEPKPKPKKKPTKPKEEEKVEEPKKSSKAKTKKKSE